MTSRPLLSVVVPAYNEATRLPGSLATIQEFLAGQAFSAEVIVVDDGSSDGTAALAEARRERWPALRVVRNPHRGKAYAVRSGVLASTGEIVFQCDADLSMPIGEIAKFLPLVRGGCPVVIGSREAAGARRYNEPPHRHLMGRVFNSLVRALVLGGLRDTQCGFKCFSRRAAFEIFPRLRVRTDDVNVRGPMVTGFDVEVLYLARKLGYRVVEIGVDWYYAPGSKVNPVRDTLRMLADLLKVRLNDWRGGYDLPRSPSPEVTHG
ncbi:MAG: dolichyl-phosphate beta-glucosyltransferase [Chloroflexota bacterium]